MVIREYVTANGATVRIADDCCRPPRPGELTPKAALRRVLDRIAATQAEGGNEDGGTEGDRPG